MEKNGLFLRVTNEKGTTYCSPAEEINLGHQIKTTIDAASRVSGRTLLINLVRRYQYKRAIKALCL